MLVSAAYIIKYNENVLHSKDNFEELKNSLDC